MRSYSRDLLRFSSSSARDGKHCSSPILRHDSCWDKFLATEGACWPHHQGRGEISIGVSLIIRATRCATRGISGFPVRTQAGSIASDVDHIFRMEVLDQNDMTVGSRNRWFLKTSYLFPKARVFRIHVI